MSQNSPKKLFNMIKLYTANQNMEIVVIYHMSLGLDNSMPVLMR